jgi:hypothetical protein
MFSFYDPAVTDPKQTRTALMEGRRFNINRPFGNGVDDDGNQIVDEYFNGATNLDSDNSTPQNIIHPAGGGSNVQLATPINNRVAFARNLFVLGYMVARPRNKDLNGDGQTEATDGPTAGNLDVQFLAQWVANIVDFRDADSINFAF